MYTNIRTVLPDLYLHNHAVTVNSVHKCRPAQRIPMNATLYLLPKLSLRQTLECHTTIVFIQFGIYHVLVQAENRKIPVRAKIRNKN